MEAGLGIVPTRAGEWLGHLDHVMKRSCLIALDRQTCPQDPLPALWRSLSARRGAFLPLKGPACWTARIRCPISLGPRIMRADTAAIAALAAVQLILGDW